MNYKKILQGIKEKEGDNLKGYVTDYILDIMNDYEGTSNEKIKSWFDDLWVGGCQSGMISELIYYPDTHKFYDRFYNDIEDLRLEYKGGTGKDLPIDNDLKNTLAWFGFEETARKISNELEL